jgi:hypothetical protein
VSTRGGTALLVALAIVAGACSDDDAASPTTTATTSSGRPETTAAASTAQATTTAPTTAAPATTQSAEHLKSEIEAAYRDLDARGFALLQNPTLDGLDAKVAEIAVPGSPYAQAIVERVTELVNKGQFMRPNFNSIERLTIESIDITGNGTANVTACQVSNAVTIKVDEKLPTPGHSIPVGGTGNLYASRVTQSMVRTADGWRHDGVADPNDPVWEGLDSCPPA